MSYRNPQIIVDRSAEIWAQGVTNIGKIVGQGLQTYFKVRQEAKDKKAKIDEAINSSIIQGELEADAKINRAAKSIKDVSLREQFSEQAKLLANGGEDGKGAIWYNTQLSLNPPTDKNILNLYKNKVKEYQNYMSNSSQEIGNVMAALEEVEGLNAQQIITNYTVSGEGKNELENLIAMRALQNKPLAGVNYSKNLIRNEDGTNSVKVEAYLDPEGATYKAWQKTGIIDDKGLTVGENGKVKLTWERNLSTWGEDGSFVRRIPDERDRNKTMKDAQILDDKDALTKDFTYSNSVSHIVTDASGTGTRSIQKVINIDALEKNKTYMAEIESQAVGIEALPQKDEIDFVRNRLGWGNISEKEYFSKTRDQRLDFFFRKATKSDVEVLNVPGLKVGDDILVSTIKDYSYQAPKVTGKSTKKASFKQKAAERAVADLLSDPLGYLRSIIGKKSGTDVGKSSFDNNILRVSRTSGEEDVIEEYDLTNKNDIKKIARDLYGFKSGKNQEIFEYIDQYVDSIPEESVFDEFEQYAVKEN